MESPVIIISFIKSIGGPRNLMLILVLLIFGLILLYQYAGKRRDPGSPEEREASRNKLKDILIAGLALVLIVSFLVIILSFIHSLNSA